MAVLEETSLHAVIERYRSQGRRIPTELCLKLAVECCLAREHARRVNAEELRALAKAGNRGAIQALDIAGADGRTLIVPSVFMISRDGYVRMLLPGDPTRGEPILGTFSYFSPEVASGLNPDTRFEVFALGAIVWELLAGRVLFKGTTDYNTVELVREGKVPPLAPLNPDVDEHLEAIVRTALAKAPEDRYERVALFRVALERYLATRGIVSTAYDVRAVLDNIEPEDLDRLALR